MSSGKRLLGILGGLISGAFLMVLFTRIKEWNSRKRLLRNIDVFAEPVEEKFNEFVDSITVKFDKIKEVIYGFIEQKRTKSVESNRNVKT